MKRALALIVCGRALALAQAGITWPRSLAVLASVILCNWVRRSAGVIGRIGGRWGGAGLNVESSANQSSVENNYDHGPCQILGCIVSALCHPAGENWQRLGRLGKASTGQANLRQNSSFHDFHFKPRMNRPVPAGGPEGLSPSCVRQASTRGNRAGAELIGCGRAAVIAATACRAKTEPVLTASLQCGSCRCSLGTDDCPVRRPRPTR